MSTTSPGRRIERNAVALLLGRVAAAAATLAVVSIAAHRLSVDGFGLVVSTVAAGFLANTLVTFGTDTLVTRSIAAGDPDDPDEEALAIVAASLRLQLGASVVIAICAAIAVVGGAPGVLLVQAVALVPLAVVTVTGAVLRGRQDMEPLFWSALASGVVGLGATGVGFAVATEPWVPVLALGLGACAAAAMQTLAVGHGRIDTAASLLARSSSSPVVGPHVGALARRAAPFAGMVVLAAVGAQGGLLLVEFLATEPTGGYGAALRLTEAGRLIPAAVIGAYFPALVHGVPDIGLYRRRLGYLAAYAVVAVAALLALAGPIDRWVFDAQPDGAALIRILALTLPITVARLALSFEAIANERERLVLASAAMGTAVLVIGGALLAPGHGAIGVAWVQVAGIAVSVIVLLAAGRGSATPVLPPTATAVRAGERRGRFG